MTREKLIETLSDIRAEYNCFEPMEQQQYHALSEAIEALTERKTGKWVNNIHDLPICDQCGYMTPYDRAIDDYEYGHYCSNCGAKMEVEE